MFMMLTLTVARADSKADDTFLQDLVNPNLVPDGSDNLLTGRKCPTAARINRKTAGTVSLRVIHRLPQSAALII